MVSIDTFAGSSPSDIKYRKTKHTHHTPPEIKFINVWVWFVCLRSYNASELL